MDADALTVWIEAQRLPAEVRIVPHLRAKETARLRYRLRVSRSGAAGSSEISQSGEIEAVANEMRTLSEVRLGGDAPGRCVAKVDIYRAGAQVGRYEFDCSR